MRWTYCSVLALASAMMATSQASAAVILFDDAMQNGASYWADGGSTSGPTVAGQPVYSGTTAISIVRGAWSQAGIMGLGAAPADAPILRLRFYREDTGTFVLRLSDVSSTAVWLGDSNQAYWTIDGVNSNVNNTLNAWHTLEINVPAMNLSHSIARIGVGNQKGTAQWYFDDIAWVAIPEPSSLALVGLAGVGLMSRRRRQS